jgi:ABC-type lipoprotein export system ATPase subunit
VTSFTLHKGTDKHGAPEPYDALHFDARTSTAIVGPTGSGKSRLLADIEWLAMGDSPSGRVLEATGKAPLRVARVAQQMQFSVDLRVGEFLRLHGAATGTPGSAVPVLETIRWANDLVGETFDEKTPLALLSGGQSRALMIADALLISRADVLLIDELENAGIHRWVALERLLEAEAVVVLATHDPLIALHASRRLIMAQGAVAQVVERCEEEDALLEALQRDAERMDERRRRLNRGERLA